MPTQPTVSVLMPVRNAAAYVASSVGSLLRQTLNDFELLVINDGSTDATLEIIRSFSDRRIRVIGDHHNYGIAARLNEGLDSAAGRFIARMDADDIAAPRRLARQVDFLSANETVDLVGSAAAYIDVHGGLIGAPREYPLTDFEIKLRLLTSNCLLHPTVMFRRRGTDFRYSTEFQFAQDYELWLRLAEEKTYANLPEVLLLQRRHDGAVSFEKRVEQKRLAGVALKRFARDFASFSLADPVAAVLVDPSDLRPSDCSTFEGAINFLLFMADTMKNKSAARGQLPSDFISQEIVFFAMRCFYSALVGRQFSSIIELAATVDRSSAGRGMTTAIFGSVFRYSRQRRRLNREGNALGKSLVEQGWQLGAATAPDR
jgi:glycosyltransferase involved in cell wall biosynthesis